MESIWSKTCKFKKRSSLNGDIQTEAAVIGGGMAGILTAYQLQNAGIKTVVLEAQTVGSGQTQNTTAKITSQHGRIYDRLIEEKGKEKAGKYFQANQKAVEEYQRIIDLEQISCDFERISAYVYSQNEDQLKKEAEAAVSLGASASYVKHIEIPIACAGAVKFENQAQFHPLKFLKALAEKLEIYEYTPVKTVEEQTIITDKGKVSANYIIFATHYPFLNYPGLYFTRLHQERSYVLALEQAGSLSGMYIGDGADAYSFRSYGRYLLLGGQGHRTGENREGEKYEHLRLVAKQYYPQSREIACWSAQDCISGDQIPFIGEYAAGHPGWFVATGFQKWGMTSSMVAATMLRDRICNVDNPYANTFSPSRFSTAEMFQIVQDSAKAVKGLAKRFFQIPAETAKSLQAGHGGIVECEGEKAGVYKNKQGELFAVDIRCPHLGCQLTWNPDEKTWDCPCHGSRFDYHGNLLEGPAQEGIGGK